jgi:hypothetical protein
MRSLIVVVEAVRAQDRLEVSLVEDKHPVEALAATTSDPALSVCVRPRRHEWGQDRSSAFRLEYGVGFGREFLVPIVDHNARLDAFFLELPLRFRACWVTQASVGWAVQLAATTLRVARCTCIRT